jgi:hypothetical protein
MISTQHAYFKGPTPIAARLIILIVAAFYAYGALVHVLNMGSLTGFDWGQAPVTGAGRRLPDP